MKKRITTAARKHQDYLRRKGLAVGKVYMQRLASLRHKEAKRVLTLCQEYDDKLQWQGIIQNNLSEAGYIYDWYKGLYLNVGIPQAKSVVRDISRSKAADLPAAWEQGIADFAVQRAGRNIVSVTGTFKDELCDIVGFSIEANPNMGVEALTKEIIRCFDLDINTWMARRIAQTETMIGLAEAGAVAAASTEIPFTKTWCISGVGNTRESHQIMDGVTVDEGEYFDMGEGCFMAYPHDISTNAPAEQIINCACCCIRSPK